MADIIDAGGLEKLGKALELNAAQAKTFNEYIKETKKNATELFDVGGRAKGMQDSFDAVKNSLMRTDTAVGDLLNSLLRLNGVSTDGAIGAIGDLTNALLGSGRSGNEYIDMIDSIGTAVQKTLGPEAAGLFRTTFGGIPLMFDALTEKTRQFKGDVIGLGSAYGLSFDQIARKTVDYQKAVIESNYYTFEGMGSVRAAALALSKYGVTIDETMRSVSVGSTSLNLLKEGFLLSSATGLQSGTIFKMLGEVARTMGYSIENANKPIVAMQNIARDTGLPIADLANKTFGTVQQMSRLGLTVDGMGPLIRRFADSLGPAFKGLAIDEVNNLMRGLEHQINTTNAAFIGMRGGLAGPGASAVGAQLAFEDAFKDPMEIMKSLATTLSGVTGGRIIKFEEARANPALENQFKIQRDLLQQLTGNTDPQSQRTMLGVLDAVQTGRTLSVEQQSSLQDLLKDGQTKQAEQASMRDQLSRITAGLQAQTNVTLGNILNRMVPSQVQGEFARKATDALEPGFEKVLKQAEAFGTRIADSISGTVNKGLPQPGLGAGPTITAGVSPYSEQMLQGLYQTRPRAGTAPAPAPPAAETGKMTQTNAPAGASPLQNVVITVKADANETSQWLSRQIKAVVDNTNAGGNRQ